MSHDIVIVAAGRTAVGSFNGGFANTPAHDLGAAVIKASWSAPRSMPPRSTRRSSARC